MPRPRPDGTKKCPLCGEVKSVLEFYSSPKYDGGYSPYCRSCTAIKNKQNRNKPKRNAYMKKKYAEDPEPFKERSRKIQERLKKERPAYFRAKKFFDVKREGVADDVTKEYLENLFFTTTHCQCCGKKLILEYLPSKTRKSRSNPDSPSVDRVDNGLGYTRDNIAIICWECNYRKTDLSRKDLLMLLNYIERCCSVR